MFTEAVCCCVALRRRVSTFLTQLKVAWTSYESVGNGDWEYLLTQMQEKYGIGAEESMAFGDFLNDESLLEQCTESYAMRNGHPLLKEKAKYIAPSNDEDGVMSVLLGLY